MIKLKRILCVNPGQSLHTSGQSCFKHILLVNPGQSFTLLVNPSHFWSITSGRSFPCHVCNFWSILHTSNQSVTLLPVTSGQSLTLLGSILHRSIRVKMQSESSTVYWRSKRSHKHKHKASDKICFKHMNANELILMTYQTEKNSVI